MTNGTLAWVLTILISGSNGPQEIPIPSPDGSLKTCAGQLEQVKLSGNSAAYCKPIAVRQQQQPKTEDKPKPKE